MRGSKLIAAATLASLSLAGCHNADRGRAAGICTPFAEAASASSRAPAAGLGAQAAAGDPAAGLDDCLHRWGYTLAASSDRAQEVAQAVVAACTPALTRWNQQMLSASAAAQGPGPSEMAPSLLTGEPTTPIAEHYSYAQARALFYVVQGRAGRCPPPPAAAGSR